MGRRALCRRVSYLPSVNFFKPAGIPLGELEEVCLSVEELEAIRLKDIEDLEQEQCAEKMNVSRTTFVRILDAARKKMAEALINGKAIRIEGGHFEVAGTADITPLQLKVSGPGCRRRYRHGQVLGNNTNKFVKESSEENEDTR